MAHFPRKPVRFIEANNELLDVQKSVSSSQGSSPGTNYSGPTETAYPAKMQSQYRTPADRESGNEMFRRYPDGTLDYKYAAHKVIEAVHKYRDGCALTGIEKTALSCCFPNCFSFHDIGVGSAMRAVNLRLSFEEHLKVSSLVSAHLMGEMEFMLSSHAR